MGLDMYLTGYKYFMTDFDNPSNDRTEDGYRIESMRLELGYWRKHPNLHGYIVKTFANGNDDCDDINLTSENIDTIIDAVRNPKSLPHTTGFFFGESAGSDEEAQEDVRIFQEAKSWLAAHKKGEYRSVIYRASW